MWQSHSLKPTSNPFKPFKLNLKHSLYLFIYVLASISKFLIKNFVRSRESETWHSPDLAFCTYQSFECYGQTSRQAEYLTS